MVLETILLCCCQLMQALQVPVPLQFGRAPSIITGKLRCPSQDGLEVCSLDWKISLQELIYQKGVATELLLRFLSTVSSTTNAC